MNPLKFTVPGIARPQGSKKYVGNGRSIESSKYVADWRSWVRLKAEQAMAGSDPIEGPVMVVVTFIFDRPKKHSTSKGLRHDAPLFHTSKPDVDKLLRAILDAMKGVVFGDDSQVAAANSVKKYGKAAATEIEIGRPHFM